MTATATSTSLTTMMTLAEAHALVPGSRLVGDGAVAIARVHSDTRTLAAGDLFVALAGERFDGNQFLPQARDAGAVAALAHLGCLARAPGLAGLEVPDTLAALQQLAAGWRARQPALQLIAVTGSNGKTTVTQMLAAILRAAAGDAALATRGNLNNHIGVPLMLLALRPQHRLAALELGTNHVGEIALLAELVRPTVALVNNAQREHQEFLHGVEAVARENGSVIARVPPAGAVVLPLADAFTPLWREMARSRGIGRVVTFGLADAGVDATAGVAAGVAAGVSTGVAACVAADVAADARADVSAQAAWDAAAGRWRLAIRTPTGPIDTTLAQPGRHNVLNALAAAACALAAGVPLAAVATGLSAFAPVAGRTRVRRLVRGVTAVTLVDDSYNANPDSVRAAIDVLAGLPGPRWLLLADMAEVGDDGPAFHAEVGAHARARGIEHVWSAGPQCARLGLGRHFADVPALLAALQTALQPAPVPGAAAAAVGNPASAAASVLVKGSRSMRMERAVAAFAAAWPDGAAGEGA